MANTYRVEVLLKTGKWFTNIGLHDVNRSYGLGYLAHHRVSPGPRRAMRLIRIDSAGKVTTVDDVSAKDEVDAGMCAGFPSPAQYVVAGTRAIGCARNALNRRARRQGVEVDQTLAAAVDDAYARCEAAEDLLTAGQHE